MNLNFTLEPTASLVLELSAELYQDSLTRQFLKQFDLSSGSDLIHFCHQLSPLFKEILLNRKFWAFDSLSKSIKAVNQPCQIILLAAGKTPLALQLLASHQKLIQNIYEVDITPFADKLKVYHHLSVPYLEKIQLIQKNITDSDLIDTLKQKKLMTSLPTFIMLEGISYYISEENLEAIIQNTSHLKHAKVFLDFKYPYHPSSQYINETHLHQLFDKIKKTCYLNFITEYSLDTLKAIIDKYSNAIEYQSMYELEKMRKGQNTFFTPSSEKTIGLINFKINGRL